jgi:ribosome-associated protein
MVHMDSEALLKLTQDSLDDLKARDLSTLDVRDLTSVTDYLVIASGTSDRHVSSLADNVIRNAKDAGVRPIGVEGQDAGEWVLIDLQDVIVHVMQPRVREFYKLEDLWTVGAESVPTRAENRGT